MKNVKSLTVTFHRAFGVWVILSSSTLTFAVTFGLFSGVGVNQAVAFVLSLVLGTACGTALILRNPNSLASYASKEKAVRRLSRVSQTLFRRAYLLLKESPMDLVIDVARLLSFVTVSIILATHLMLESPTLHAGQAAAIVTLSCIVLIIFSSFVYPMIRSQSRWDYAYRYRKVLSAHALNYAANTLTARNEEEIIEAAQKIEGDALRAIKSYLEYSVTDRSGKNFDVNLIVVSPNDPSIFACVARATEGQVPTLYRRENMKIASKSLSEGKPIYIGDFHSSRGRPVRMIWHIPIASHGQSIQGLVAIDSLIPRHLNLFDERQSLLFNILPFLALLRFSLSLRSRNRIWHSIFMEQLNDAPLALPSYGKMEVDKAFDERVLNVLSTSSLESEYKNLQKITESIAPISSARRLFSTLFQNVEKNNQRIRG